MTIPKKIHWCWLSGDPLPKHLQKCVDSWQRIMPDYEIICWDKSRFDIHSIKFVEDAYNNRKWAFAADYIRLYALYTEGGIYLDSDVLVFKKFDRFLNHNAFSAIEYHPGKNMWAQNGKNTHGYNAIQAAIIGAIPNNKWIKLCMDHYTNEKKFKMTDNIVEVEIIPDALARYAYNYFDFQPDIPYTETQYLKDNIVIYPPKIFSTAYLGTNMQTYAMHLCDGSWYNKSDTFIQAIERKLCTSYRFFAMLHYKKRQLFNNLP
ncbi:MAG: polysaccharide biosynthesis protein [Prevotellaceae bacterium]|jgi:mannosyltransferase OCH1-like enzyme|nr:polysaccharide biosynthesis protein [Prevotellaceae bacterium]